MAPATMTSTTITCQKASSSTATRIRRVAQPEALLLLCWATVAWNPRQSEGDQGITPWRCKAKKQRAVACPSPRAWSRACAQAI